jgi:hypothetical protein
LSDGATRRVVAPADREQIVDPAVGVAVRQLRYQRGLSFFVLRNAIALENRSLLSGYKVNRFNWLELSSKSSWKSKMTRTASDLKCTKVFESALDDVHRSVGFHILLTVAAVVADSPFLESNLVSDDARAP